MKVSLVEVYHCRTLAFLPAYKFTVQWRTGTSVILGTLSLEIKRPEREANHSSSPSDMYLRPPAGLHDVHRGNCVFYFILILYLTL